MDRKAALDYVRRDWSALEALRLREKSARFQSGGSAASVLASRRLWERVYGSRGRRPSARARAADLAHHIELKRRFDRAARGFRLR